MNKQTLAILILRIGIAFSFLYVAIFSFLNPNSWIGFFPKPLQDSTILIIFSIYEILLAALLILNKKVYYVSMLSALTLFGVIIFNLGALDIVFRDITILLASIALTILSRD
jgi:hypothetical protein